MSVPGMSDERWAHIRAGRSPTPARVDAVAHDEARLLGTQGASRARAELRAATLGLGPLESVVALPGVSDVLVNGTGGVWIDRGEGLEHHPAALGDAAEVRRLAVRLAGLADRRLDESNPYVDGLLPGGVRLHAVLPPLVDDAAHISLRVPRVDVVSLPQLVQLGSMPPAWEPVLEAIMAARLSFLISGGTGTGKTTLLAGMLARVAGDERILVVEDVRELAVHHPHVVRLQARPANVEGAGAVDMVALVRQSLRMRPDRLIVGEVRGAEVREMLTALNTGHEGGCGTVHANSETDIINRFEALGALADMSPAAVRSQLASAVNVVVHLRRTRRGRRVASIGVLAQKDGALTVHTALRNPDAAGERERMTRPEAGPRRLRRGPLRPPGVVEPGWGMLSTLLGWENDGLARAAPSEDTAEDRGAGGEPPGAPDEGDTSDEGEPVPRRLIPVPQSAPGPMDEPEVLTTAGPEPWPVRVPPPPPGAQELRPTCAAPAVEAAMAARQGAPPVPSLAPSQPGAAPREATAPSVARARTATISGGLALATLDTSWLAGPR